MAEAARAEPIPCRREIRRKTACKGSLLCANSRSFVNGTTDPGISRLSVMEMGTSGGLGSVHSGGTTNAPALNSHPAMAADLPAKL